MNQPRTAAPRSWRRFVPPSGLAATGLCALALGTSAGRTGETLRFSPAGAAELSKTFSATYDMTLEELSLLVDGQDIGEMLGQPEVDLTLTTGINLIDTYVASDARRPLKLLRRFDAGNMAMDVSAAMAGESQEDSQETASSLNGLQVVYTWNPETESYDLAFAEDQAGDASLLEGLVEETDMRSVLPREEVSVDDTWEFNVADLLMQTSAPAGDLHFEFEGAEDSDEMEAILGPLMEEFGQLGEQLMAGVGKATYKGLIEQDGLKLGSIELELKIDNTVDVSALLGRIVEEVLAEQEGVPEDVAFDFSAANISVSVEGTGILLWNPATGLPHSCNLDGEASFGLELGASVSAEGESQSFDVKLAFSGSMSQTLTTQ